LTPDRPPVIIGQNPQEMSAVKSQFFPASEGSTGLRSLKKQFSIIDDMKKKWPVFLLLLLLSAAQAAVQAQSGSGDGFGYSINPDNTNTITITGHGGIGGDLIIPTNINSLLVTGIGADAFYEQSSVTSVTIPCTVTCIGGGAFILTSLSSVTIPGSVTNIGESAFASTSLATITVDEENSFYSSSNGVLFDKNQTTLVEFPSGIGGSYTIPNGVTIIGDGAFALCTSLTSVTVPNGVTSIESNAFYYCPSLTNLTIPGSVTSIGDSAFEGCTSLTSLYFTGSAPTIGSYVFDSYISTTTYYLPGTTGWSYTFWGYPTSGPPAVLWNPLIQANGADFGVQNNQFGFNITNANNLTVVLEACTNLASPVWSPLQTFTLTNGSFYFSDPQWTNYPARFYGLGFP
jgi:hypothetical protein